MTMTRREFAQAMAVPCAMQLRGAVPLRIGIGAFTYHSLSLEAMIRELKALNIDEIEMSRGEYMLLSHPKPELFEWTRGKLDAAGIRCVSYYSGDHCG